MMAAPFASLQHCLPAWLQDYRRDDFVPDVLASLTLTLLLIPQSLAYALLAGLPPQVGLYASIAPGIVYALTGTSSLLAVGPVALASVMTAGALAGLAPIASADYVALAALLAIISGGLRMLLASLRFGFVANFLSASVVGGFIAGSALLIIVGQLPTLLGVAGVQGATFWQILRNLLRALPGFNPLVLSIALSSLLALLAWKAWGSGLLARLGVPTVHADLLGRAAPVFVVGGAALVVATLNWDGPGGVAVIGALPLRWPGLHIPLVSIDTALQLLPAALAISLVGFVDSIAVAQSLAIKRREKIDPDRELRALGLANLAAGMTGGYPVSGSFGRSAANSQAGARTQLANVFGSLWMLAVVLFASGAFARLPLAALSATIVLAVWQMLDLSILRLAWRYDRRDALVFAATALCVLFLGAVNAILVGVAFALLLFIWRTSKPHMAIVGRLPGTEHFRNVQRHRVETQRQILAVRIDESLYFANVRFVTNQLAAWINEQAEVRHLLLIMSAVNAIDVSALEGLRELNRGLEGQGIALHLAEIKGPVMDKLVGSGFLAELSGRIYLSGHDALLDLEIAPAPDFAI